MAKNDDAIVTLKGRLLEQAQRNPAKFVRKLLVQAEPELQKARVRWQRYRNKYRAGLSYLNNLSTRPPSFQANYIYSNVETVKANLPLAMPSMVVKSVDIDDKVGDDLVTKLLRSSLSHAKLRHKMKSQALHHAAITGLGWIKLTVEPDAYFGQPDNAIQVYPPESILVDPLAVPFYDATGRVTARYIIERRMDVPLEEVEGLYPDFDPELNAEGELDEEFDDKLSEKSDRSGAYGERKDSEIGKVADLLTCWINTFDREKPWYQIVMWGSKVVDKLKASPYDHPHPPYVPVFDGYDDGADSIYQAGIGEVEEIEPLQDKSNVLDQQIFKNIRLIVNRQRIVNRALGLSATNVDNTENRVYAVPGNPREAIHWDTPQQLTSDVYTYRMMVDYLIEVVSGITGTQAGRKPTGIQAAKAIERLSTNSDRRVDSKRDDLAPVYEHIGAMALSNIFQFWSDERTVGLLDGGSVTVIGDWPDNLKLPEDMEEGEQRQQIIEQRQEFKEQNGIGLVLADLKRNFNVQVTLDSALPEARADRSEILSNLFRLQAIDRRAVLDGLDYPDREEIIARMEQAEQAMQQQQGQQQQQASDQLNQEILARLDELGQAMQMLMQQMAAPPAPAAGGIPPQLLAQLMGGGGGGI